MLGLTRLLALAIAPVGIPVASAHGYFRFRALALWWNFHASTGEIRAFDAHPLAVGRTKVAEQLGCTFQLGDPAARRTLARVRSGPGRTRQDKEKEQGCKHQTTELYQPRTPSRLEQRPQPGAHRFASLVSTSLAQKATPSGMISSLKS